MVVVQSAERQSSKLDVAGSSPVYHSNRCPNYWIIGCWYANPAASCIWAVSAHLQYTRLLLRRVQKIIVGGIRLVKQISDGICKVSTHRTLGISQVVKAQDFDSCIRWFESNISSHMDAYLSRLEGWSYKPVALSSNLRASTIYQMKRRITSVSNGSC